MGGAHPTCGQEPDILAQQLSIYRWRADPLRNTYLPRCTFKSAHIHRQETLLQQVINQKPQQPFLEISSLRSQLSTPALESEQDIILFEPIKCNLECVAGQLELSEATYSLEGLLNGFQQIRIMLRSVVIDPKCCFISECGEIRAWINPNHKSNLLPTPHSNDLKSQSSSKKIIPKVVNMVEALTVASIESGIFFDHLRNFMEGVSNGKFTHFKKLTTSDLIKCIHQFCFDHNIRPSSNLKNTFLSRSQTTKRYETAVPSTVQLSLPLQANKPLRQTMVTDRKSFEPRQSQAIMKVKSLEKKSTHFPDYPPAPQPAPKSNYCRGILPTQSQLVPQATQRTMPSPKPFKRDKNVRHTVAEGPNLSHQFFKNNSLTSPVLIGSKQKVHEYSKRSQCIQINYKPPQLIKNKTSDESKNKATVSLVGNMPTNLNKQNQPTQSYVLNRSPSNPNRFNRLEVGQSVISRPWMTNKTLTKLISESEGQDARSVTNSLQNSEDHYYGSEYSGVLTTMGRDAVIVDSQVLSQSSLMGSQ